MIIINNKLSLNQTMIHIVFNYQYDNKSISTMFIILLLN